MGLKKLLVYTGMVFFMATGLGLAPAQGDSLEHVLGLGFGLPYGGIGVNYELGLTEYVAPTLGVGFVPDTFGWNMGVRGYYPGRDYFVRGRVTLLYGTNVILEEEGMSGNDKDTETGFSLGFGVDWRFGERWGAGGDLFWADTDVPPGYDKVDNDIFISMGLYYLW
jgi:hypothetical protein